jgi:glycosyltransferase involved in cell wall biosynthesis
VSVGNDGPIKNIVMAVKAFKLIRERHPEAELHLFGPGLGATSKFVNTAIGIYGHGHVPHAELMTFLAEEAMLLIHPSLIETFGVIIGEAKIRGVPVVAGNKSGGATYVVGEAGGTLVDISCAHSIAKAASDILSSKDYLRMQNDAHEDIIVRFLIQAIAEQYEAIYRRIMT